MTDAAFSSAILERLDQLIRIQVGLAVKDMPTQKAKILFLSGVGFGPKDIAAMLGTTPTTVSVAMAKHKKASGEQDL